VLAIIGAGVSVSTISRSAIAINPESEEATALRGWWDATGCTAALTHAGEGLSSALKCAPSHSPRHAEPPGAGVGAEPRTLGLSEAGGGAPGRAPAS
jgi:hypothetical protein